MNALIFESNPLLLTLALAVILLGAIELAYRGARYLAIGTHDDKSWDTVRAGILTLVAFMLGLTYAQAQSRFDSRRELVVKEANAIGTTWLRADQLDPTETIAFRHLLTEYTRERLQAYGASGDTALHQRVMKDSDIKQGQLWSLASSALRRHPTDQGKSLLVSTLNDTIDVSSEQLYALTHHVPIAVLVLTFILTILGALIIGLQFARDKSRPVALTILYALTSAIVLNLIVDFDRPQAGFIHVPLDPLSIQLKSMQS